MAETHRKGINEEEEDMYVFHNLSDQKYFACYKTKEGNLF